MARQEHPRLRFRLRRVHPSRRGRVRGGRGDRAAGVARRHAGGVREGRALKAVIPGGSSVPILLPDQLDTQASFEGVQKAGSLLGSAGIIVVDDTACMVWLAENLLHFYRHESCGKCTPCREGTDWLHKILRKIERGEGQMRDLDLLSNISANIAGKTLCAFGDAAVTPLVPTLKAFRHA